MRGAVKSVGVLNFPFSFTKRAREQSVNIRLHNTPESSEEILTGFVNRFASLTPDSIARELTLIELYLIKNIQVSSMADKS